MLNKIMSINHFHDDVALRFRSRSLIKVDLAAGLLFFFFVIQNLMEGDYAVAAVELILIGIFVSNIFILKRGRYKLAANMVITFCFIAGAAVAFISSEAVSYEGFKIFTYYMPTLVALALFGYTKRQAYIFLFCGEILLLYSLFFRVAPSTGQNMEELLYLFLPPMMLFLICNFFVIQVMDNNDKTFSAMKHQEKDTLRRYAELNKLVEVFKDNLNLGQDLHDLAQSSSDSAHDITDQLVNMKNVMDGLESQMNETADAQTEILQAGQQVHQGMASQTEALRSSSAAVDEMAASISSLSDATKSRMDELNKLKESSDRSEYQIKESGRLMDEMLASNSRINEITSVIEDVGSQTNLLAMNASIEAAHAGEVGKGFSVVAGEIRKLAETTNAQSRQIRELLEKSNQNSRTAVDQSREALSHFSEIKEQIDAQALAMEELFTRLNALDKNAGDITGSVSSLLEANKTVNESVAVMSRRIGNNHVTIDKSKKAVEDVGRMTEKINGASDSLASDSRTLAEIGRKNTENLKTMESELQLLR